MSMAAHDSEGMWGRGRITHEKSLCYEDLMSWLESFDSFGRPEEHWGRQCLSTRRPHPSSRASSFASTTKDGKEQDREEKQLTCTMKRTMHTCGLGGEGSRMQHALTEA